MQKLVVLKLGILGPNFDFDK